MDEEMTPVQRFEPDTITLTRRGNGDYDLVILQGISDSGCATGSTAQVTAVVKRKALNFFADYRKPLDAGLLEHAPIRLRGMWMQFDSSLVPDEGVYYRMRIVEKP